MTIPNGSAGNCGPFRPGPGGLPPCLAGREEEQALFRRRLDELRRGIPPPAEIVLYGPRGNGKTALLFWLEELAKERRGVEVIGLAPSFFDGPTDLAREIQPRSRWRVLVPKRIFFRRPEAPASQSLEEALTKRVSKKPLILLLDEAHRLDADTCRLLLDASQKVGRRSPFLLVLAGTPDLEARLSASGASFWNRADRRRIGRLSDAATTAAFSEPFEAEGVALTPDASADLVRVSHGYPFFIQLLGGQVWGQLAARPEAADKRVTTREVEAALPGFRERQRLYYLDRYRELGRRGVLAPAQTVAARFAEGCAELTDGELREAIARGLGKSPESRKAAAAERELADLGFVWTPGAEPAWEPGIPSLMDYVIEHAPAGGGS